MRPAQEISAAMTRNSRRIDRSDARPVRSCGSIRRRRHCCERGAECCSQGPAIDAARWMGGAMLARADENRRTGVSCARPHAPLLPASTHAAPTVPRRTGPLRLRAVDRARSACSLLLPCLLWRGPARCFRRLPVSRTILHSSQRTSRKHAHTQAANDEQQARWSQARNSCGPVSIVALLCCAALPLLRWLPGRCCAAPLWGGRSTPPASSPPVPLRMVKLQDSGVMCVGGRHGQGRCSRGRRAEGAALRCTAVASPPFPSCPRIVHGEPQDKQRTPRHTDKRNHPAQSSGAAQDRRSAADPTRWRRSRRSPSTHQLQQQSRRQTQKQLQLLPLPAQQQQRRLRPRLLRSTLPLPLPLHRPPLLPRPLQSNRKFWSENFSRPKNARSARLSSPRRRKSEAWPAAARLFRSRDGRTRSPRSRRSACAGS